MEFKEANEKSVVLSGNRTKNNAAIPSRPIGNIHAKAEKLVTDVISKHLGRTVDPPATNVSSMSSFHSNFGELVTLAKNSYQSWMLSQTSEATQKEYFDKMAQKPIHDVETENLAKETRLQELQIKKLENELHLKRLRKSLLSTSPTNDYFVPTSTREKTNSANSSNYSGSDDSPSRLNNADDFLNL